MIFIKRKLKKKFDPIEHDLQDYQTNKIWH